MKKVIVVLAVLILLTIITLFPCTGGETGGVILSDYSVSQDNKTLTLKVQQTGSMGYIRTFKEKQDRNEKYITFYLTNGLNSSIGAKNEFEIALDSSCEKIYFYCGNNSYKLMLYKNMSTSNWEKAELNRHYNDGYVNLNINNFTGASMRVKEGTVTPKGLTLEITSINKNDCIYGDEYSLEAYKDKQWYLLNDIVDGRLAWDAIGYPVYNGETSEFSVDWTNIYGELGEGDYRIVKPILDFRGADDFDQYYLATEFTIASN